MVSKSYFLVAVFLSLGTTFLCDEVRHRRHLYYPDPARTQLVIGLGLPLGLPQTSATVATVFKFNTNLRSWNSSFINGQSRYSVNRWDIYTAIEALINSLNIGVDGHQCLLRAICDLATVPFDTNSGLAAQLLHILLTPSSSTEVARSHPEEEFEEAERHGLQGECSYTHDGCPFSILDQVTRFFAG